MQWIVDYEGSRSNIINWDAGLENGRGVISLQGGSSGGDTNYYTMELQNM